MERRNNEFWVTPKENAFRELHMRRPYLKDAIDEGDIARHSKKRSILTLSFKCKSLDLNVYGRAILTEEHRDSNNSKVAAPDDTIIL